MMLICLVSLMKKVTGPAIGADIICNKTHVVWIYMLSYVVTWPVIYEMIWMSQ